MPNANDNAKMSGDTHLPDLVESEFSVEAGEEEKGVDRGQAKDQASSGRGVSQEGEIKDKDAKTSNSYGNTRDSGEGR